MFESKVNKGKANGYTPLGYDSKVSTEYLPTSLLLTINPYTISTITIPSGNNALLIGPVGISNELIVENNAILIII